MAANFQQPPNYQPQPPPSYPPSYHTVEPANLQQQPSNPGTVPAQPFQGFGGHKKDYRALATKAGSIPIDQVFHIYGNNGFRGRKTLDLMAADKSTPAYCVDYRSYDADLVVHRGNINGPVVGKITFHRWSGYVEIVFYDPAGKREARVEMHKDGHFTRRHMVELPAGASPNPEDVKRNPALRPSDHRIYFWKGTHEYGGSGLVGGHLKLEDGVGRVFASYARVAASSKEGRLNILVLNLDQRFVDQIVVSFVGMYEQERRRRKRSAAAGGAGGAAGGGGGGGC